MRSTSLAVADMPEAWITVYSPADEETRTRLPLTRRRGRDRGEVLGAAHLSQPG